MMSCWFIRLKYFPDFYPASNSLVFGHSYYRYLIYSEKYDEQNCRRLCSHGEYR
jgi:hypothetical protein